jgi:hypothetical protein
MDSVRSRSQPQAQLHAQRCFEVQAIEIMQLAD